MYNEELRKLAEGFETLPLVMDRDYNDPAELGHKIIALCGLAVELETLRGITESPNVSWETVESVERDMITLIKKFNVIIGR